MQWISLLSCVAFLCAATVLDIKTRKIPNILSFSGIIAGAILLLLNWIIYGNWYNFFVGIILAFLVFLFGMTRLLGLGDIKVLMAVCLLSGPLSMFGTTALGALFSLVVWLIKTPKETITDIRAGLLMLTGFNPGKGRSVAFVPYLLAGFIVMQAIICLWISPTYPTWI